MDIFWSHIFTKLPQFKQQNKPKENSDLSCFNTKCTMKAAISLKTQQKLNYQTLPIKYQRDHCTGIVAV